MSQFDYHFTVNAPVTAVHAFHHDTRVLKKLTPPPIFAQIHTFEPLAEGSRAEFTLWFGPLPVRWTAVHHHVSPAGFTDRQEKGPLQFWEHMHRFTAVNTHTTRIQEQIIYEYFPGRRGWFSRLLFNKLGLFMLFTARKWLTRYHLRRFTAHPVLES